MGKESPLKLRQRGSDAGEEVPMRTPKRLYAEERIIYHPELLTCLHCGDLLVAWNYLAWDKTVQTLDGLLSIATRPGRCPHAPCPGARLRLLSAVAQRVAPPGSTYGYDVLVHIGWLRQHQRATYRAIHTDLAVRFPISESHVRYLYQHLYLPLLACHERQQHGRLAQVAQCLRAGHTGLCWHSGRGPEGALLDRADCRLAQRRELPLHGAARQGEQAVQ